MERSDDVSSTANNVGQNLFGQRERLQRQAPSSERYLVAGGATRNTPPAALNSQLRSHFPPSCESSGSNVLKKNNVGGVGMIQSSTSRMAPSRGYNSNNARRSSNLNRSVLAVDECVSSRRGKSIVPNVFPSASAFMEFAIKHDPWLHQDNSGKNNVDEKLRMLNEYVVPTISGWNNGSSSNKLQTAESGVYAASQADSDEVVEVFPQMQRADALHISRPPHARLLPFVGATQPTIPQVQRVGILSQNHVNHPRPAWALHCIGASSMPPHAHEQPTIQQVQQVEISSQNHVNHPQHAGALHFGGATPMPPRGRGQENHVSQPQHPRSLHYGGATPLPPTAPRMLTPMPLFDQSGIRCIFCFSKMSPPLEQKWCGHYFHQTCFNVAEDWTGVRECDECRPELDKIRTKRCKFCLGELPVATEVKPCGHYFHLACWMMNTQIPTSISDCRFCISE